MCRRELHRSLLVVVFGLLLLLSSGCIRFSVQTTVNPDGSGSRTIETVLDRSLSDLAQLSGEASAAAFESQLRDALPPNAALRSFVRDGQRHYVARFGFSSVAELNEINRGESRSRGPLTPTASLRVAGNPFFTTYDYTEYLPPLSEPLSAQEREMTDDVAVDFRLTLPGTIVSSDADAFPDASSASWRIPLLEGRRVRATSRWLNWPVITGTAIGAIALIGAAVFATSLLRRRRREGAGADASKSEPAPQRDI